MGVHLISLSETRLGLLGSAMLLLLSLPAGSEATPILGASAGTGPVTSPDGQFIVSVTPRPVNHLAGISAGDLTILRMAYPNWTFIVGGADTGTFNVLQYEPFALNQVGGADFVVLYDDEKPSPRTDYNWIQIAHSHNWGSFAADRVDTRSDFPFYSNLTPDQLPTLRTRGSDFAKTPSIWNTSTDYPAQNVQNPSGGGRLPPGDLIFDDEPYMDYAHVPEGDFSSVDFALFLVIFDWNGQSGTGAGGAISILDGMKWGVRIDRGPLDDDGDGDDSGSGDDDGGDDDGDGDGGAGGGRGGGGHGGPNGPPQVPEPTTWMLVALGLTAIVLARRHHQPLAKAA